MALSPDDPINTGDTETVLGVEGVEILDVLRDDETLTLGHLFFDGFVSEYTDVDSFDEFIAQSPVTVDSVADFETAPREELDEYVSAHSTFDSWAWMVQAACEEYVQRKTTY